MTLAPFIISLAQRKDTHLNTKFCFLIFEFISKFTRLHGQVFRFKTRGSVTWFHVIPAGGFATQSYLSGVKPSKLLCQQGYRGIEGIFRQSDHNTVATTLNKSKIYLTSTELTAKDVGFTADHSKSPEPEAPFHCQACREGRGR